MLNVIVRFFTEKKVERAIRISEEPSNDPLDTLAFYDKLYDAQGCATTNYYLSASDEKAISRWMSDSEYARVDEAYEVPELSDSDYIESERLMDLSRSIPLDYVYQPTTLERILSAPTRWNDARCERTIEYNLQVNLYERDVWYAPITEAINKLKFWK